MTTSKLTMNEQASIKEWDNCPKCGWFYKIIKLELCPMCRHAIAEPGDADGQNQKRTRTRSQARSSQAGIRSGYEAKNTGRPRKAVRKAVSRAGHSRRKVERSL